MEINKKVQLYLGDITTMDADAIVNAANNHGYMHRWDAQYVEHHFNTYMTTIDTTVLLVENMKTNFNSNPLLNSHRNNLQPKQFRHLLQHHNQRHLK